MDYLTKNGLKAATAMVAAALCLATPQPVQALEIGVSLGGGGGVSASVGAGKSGVDAGVSVGGGGGVSAGVSVGGSSSGGSAEVDVAIGGGHGATPESSGTGGAVTASAMTAPAAMTEAEAERKRLLLAQRLASYKGTALLSSDGVVLGRVLAVSYSSAGVEVVARLSGELGSHEGRTVKLTTDPRSLDDRKVQLRLTERRFTRSLRDL
ncbi:hypothetical protein [Vannielia litorea]|uniref:PRC-barrel domain-containing protein n=1 Tax=Vannielia litorea TaxID=1217970 RepID=A0A1N6FJZ2_9RHOB|nr:hypothetical protein [Vannielia litorea]SIN95540.1 hypothetical protein SAMN05444002_1726 [Vannielia litorea]